MRDVLLTLVFAIMMAYAYRRPWAAVLVWMWLAYMNPQRLCYGFARYGVIEFTMIAVAVTVLACFIARERNKFPWRRETVLLSLLCLQTIFTTYFAFNQQVAWAYLDRFLKIQAMIFFIFWVMQSRFRLEAMVWTIAVSLGFYGAKGGLFTLMTGGGGHVMGPPNSFIADNNDLAVALVMVLPLMRYLQVHAEWKVSRWGWIAAQWLSVVAIIGTYSRGGFLALGVVWAFQWWKSRHKIVLAMAILALGPPLFFFMPAEWRNRMATIKTTKEENLDASAEGRLNAWRMGWNMAKDHPIVGGGFRSFVYRASFQEYAPDLDSKHDAHSIYLQMLGEQGFPGLAMFLGLGLFTWGTARRVVKIARVVPEMEWAADLTTQTMLGLTGYAVGGTFAGLSYFDLPYNMMAIIVLCGVLTNRALREQKSQLAQAVAAPEVSYLVSQEA
jgi:probable O-glycosylation ligase (exosortase A-associated)